MQPQEIEAIRRKLQRLAWLLDNSIRVPGTGFRVGLDALIGLLPGLGDAVGVVLSGYIVREAARAGAPPSVLARMAFNVAVEGVVGLIPFLGDVFDAAWKANQKNVALLEAHLASPKRAARSSRVFVGLLVLGLIGFGVLVIAAGVVVFRAVMSAFGA